MKKLIVSYDPITNTSVNPNTKNTSISNWITNATSTENAKKVKKDELFAEYAKIEKNRAERQKINNFFGIGPKGLEKVILAAQKGMGKINKAVDEALYGKPFAKKEFKAVIKNPLDYGISNIIDDIVSVNYCDFINSAANIKISKKQFNPNEDPTSDPNIKWEVKAVWKLKKEAFDIQTIIDDPLGNDNQSEEENKKSIFEKITKIKEKYTNLKKIISPETQEIAQLTGIDTSPQSLSQLFPALKTILPSIEDKLAYLNKWNDARQIPISEFQKIINTLDKIRAACILIQGMNSVSDVINLFPGISRDVQEKIQKLQKIINPSRAIPFLRDKLIPSLQKINNVLRQILSIVNFCRTITRLMILFIKIFKKIIIFFQINPGPNLFTWLGLTTTMSKGERKIDDGVGNFEKRLTQINYLFNLVYSLCNTIALEIEELIVKIRALIANLQQCEDVPKEIIDSLTQQVDNLQTSLDDINKFINTKNNSEKTSTRRTAGEYTIEIITEQVIEETFNLRRRYGVALDNRGAVIVTSTPTYASLDSIIIAEVKQLLSSKGLIKTQQSDYTIREEEIIEEAKSFLSDDDINMEIDYDITPSEYIDSPENEDENSGIGLNAFINKLQGGKKLRKRVRDAKIKSNNDFIKSLKEDDPQGKYTQSITQKTQNETTKLEIEKLEADKKPLIASLTLTAANPYATAITIKKIKDIDKKISDLKNQIK